MSTSVVETGQCLCPTVRERERERERAQRCVFDCLVKRDRSVCVRETDQCCVSDSQ